MAWALVTILFANLLLRIIFPDIMDEIDDEHPSVIPLPKV